ncbi:unnamed protein product [Rhizophagus irregularis]|uniref:Uncharacterized protein n=1 Tax=Rhizophagus irregularis TaxID=588596 RepID=A0A2N1MJI2_9GLOM|nr:hypothetical protein RhiirC2_791319 [Rhizophagus irregularis]CAB5372620.1 unnamed protein product [Rhizophagus irregularis]
MFRTIFNRYSRRLIPKSPGLRNTSLGATDIESLENMLLESPQWENKVEFTLKELVLHNINQRQNDLIEHRITKAENKFLFTTICATCSIICTILSERYFAGKSYDTDNKIADVSGKKDTDKKK